MSELETNFMPFTRTIRLGTLALSLCAGGAVSQDDPDYGFEFITIGDVGNIPYLRAGIEPYGQVDYEYRISRIELNSGQYRDYFNLFLTSDPVDYFAIYPDGDTGFWGGGGSW